MKSFEAAISILGELLAEEKITPDGTPQASSTRYRHIEALRKAGLIFRAGRGSYLPQPALLEKLERFDRLAILSTSVRPAINRLARELECTAHFGVLQREMVTYLVKETATQQTLFTREMQQLEAYCSGIGKVLLAGLSEGEIERYLENGPFPALTLKTATQPESIRRLIQAARSEGYAVDDGEVHQDLFCLAVPARDHLGRTVGAISASFSERGSILDRRETVLAALNECAASVQRAFK